MILAFLATRAGKLVAGGLAVVLLIVGFWWWLHNREQDAIARDRAEAAAQIAPRQQRAEATAAATTAAIQTKAESENVQVRETARDDPDPLGAGLRELRARQTRSDASTR